MADPDYKRPFDANDFRGYFTWDSDLTKALGGCLYHACHEDELDRILEESALGLRSEWQLNHPTFGLWSAPGTWCGLNDFYENFYGPFVTSFPVAVLEGRTFMIFRREGEDRNRYFFVQYEAGIPIFSVQGKPWRRVKPVSYFDGDEAAMRLKDRAIYDVVITAPLSIEKARFDATRHPRCIPGKCGGKTKSDTTELLKKKATEILLSELERLDAYNRLFVRFPVLAGAKVRVWPKE